MQVLSLSGIGPQDVLNPLGINVLVDAPAVGANLVDHPLVGSYFSVNSNRTWDVLLRNETIFDEDLDEWLTKKQGLFVDTASNTVGFFKLPTFETFDPSTGPKSANTELLFFVCRLLNRISTMQLFTRVNRTGSSHHLAPWEYQQRDRI